MGALSALAGAAALGLSLAVGDGLTMIRDEADKSGLRALVGFWWKGTVLSDFCIKVVRRNI